MVKRKSKYYYIQQCTVYKGASRYAAIFRVNRRSHESTVWGKVVFVHLARTCRPGKRSSVAAPSSADSRLDSGEGALERSERKRLTPPASAAVMISTPNVAGTDVGAHSDVRSIEDAGSSNAFASSTAPRCLGSTPDGDARCSSSSNCELLDRRVTRAFDAAAVAFAAATVASDASRVTVCEILALLFAQFADCTPAFTASRLPEDDVLRGPCPNSPGAERVALALRGGHTAVDT